MARDETDLQRRPDPDALLALAGQEGKGRLRVFLGAAPGVGKTYAMLSRARAAKALGRDIVIGLVETHGRSETEALIEGLEVLPRRRIDYRGRTLEEFDLDAALAASRKRFSSTSSPTPTPPTAATPSAGWTWRSCSARASTSGRRSTSSISKA